MRARPTERLLGLLLAVLLPFAGPVAAEPLGGEIRFAAAAKEPAWVGQKVELYLELWTDGFTFGDQLFVLPDVAGGFLLQGDANTIKLNETREGRPWQGLRYTFFLYPQTAGRLQVPDFDVSFSSRTGFGSEPAAFRFRTEPVVVEARWPPGVRTGGLLVTTTAFSLEARWDRTANPDEPLRLLTGDAIALEVRRGAADVPGMVFAPLEFPPIDGLGVYVDNPRVEDQVNRGELSGQRVDRITFVCEEPGSYEIPELRFQWWDPVRGELAERVIAAMRLEVGENPAWRGASDAAPWGAGRIAAALGALLLLGLAPALWRLFGRGLLQWLPERRSRRAAGAPAHKPGELLPLNPRGRR